MTKTDFFGIFEHNDLNIHDQFTYILFQDRFRGTQGRISYFYVLNFNFVNN